MPEFGFLAHFMLRLCRDCELDSLEILRFLELPGWEMKPEKELNFRPIGRGFIVHTPIPGGPTGRSLAMAYTDQYNNRYIEINGTKEPLEEKHSFLAVD